MQIGPVTLDGQHVRLEPVRLAHVPALWRAGGHEEIWRYLPYTMRSEDDMRACRVRIPEALRKTPFATLC
jgi:hypothetical protein